MKLNYLLIGALASLMLVPDSYAYVKYGNKPAAKKSTHVTTSSVASSGMYVAGGLMFVPDVSFSSEYGSQSLGSAYGLRLAGGMSMNNFRLEGELKYTTGGKVTESDMFYDGMTWQTIKYESSDSQINVMANGYYDISLNNSFGLFVTGGIGLVVDMITVSETSTYGEWEETDTECLFGYQIGGGMSYKINGNTSVDFGYRFNGTSKRNSVANIYSHELSLSARYSF